MFTPVNEAINYIQSFEEKYTFEDMFISFSGGKDSTVTSDLVMKAFANSRIMHIYGDTTLEFPLTEEYRKRFSKKHTVIRAKNYEKNFEELIYSSGSGFPIFLANSTNRVLQCSYLLNICTFDRNSDHAPLFGQHQQPQGKIGTNRLKVTIKKTNIAGANSLAAAELKIKCQLTKYQMCISPTSNI